MLCVSNSSTIILKINTIPYNSNQSHINHITKEMKGMKGAKRELELSIDTNITTLSSDGDSGGRDANATQQTQHDRKRRKLQFGQSPNLQGSQNTRFYEHFRRLDPSNPVEAKRMKTRYSQIAKGKNTVGYDIYKQKVPKHKRKKIKEHPSTPDHKADIPNRRWLGLLKAWRISLHQYDPKDFQSDLNSASKKQVFSDKEQNSEKECKQHKPDNIKDQQIAEASSKGLQVDFADNCPDDETLLSRQVSSQSETTTIEENEGKSKPGFENQLDELDRWEADRKNADDDEELLLDYEDSDDELL